MRVWIDLNDLTGNGNNGIINGPSWINTDLEVQEELISECDTNDNNENICSDTDGDFCDDCSSGLFNIDNDGFDYDGDGMCDVGDEDDDNDGALDIDDSIR